MQGVVSPAQELLWIFHRGTISAFSALCGDFYEWFLLLTGGS